MRTHYITTKEAPFVSETFGEKYRISIVKQKTGFGEKTFMICPFCGVKRTRLYISRETLNLGFLCWKCYPQDFYKGVTHHDPGSTRNIVYRMNRLSEEIGVVTKIPFNPWDYILDRPRYMRHYKWEQFLRRMTILENMRIQSIGAGMIGIPKRKYKAEVIDYFMAEAMNIDISFEDLRRDLRDWEELYLPIKEQGD